MDICFDSSDSSLQLQYMQKTMLDDYPDILIPILDSTSELRSALTDVAGLPLIRRVVLMADKAGFHRIIVLCHADNETVSAALAGTHARCISIHSCGQLACQRPILLLAADCLADKTLFPRLAEQQVNPDNIALWQDNRAMLLGTNACHTVADAMARAGNFTQLAHNVCRHSGDDALKRVDEPAGLPIRNSDDCRQAEHSLLSGLVKSTEGWMALHINRKVSVAVTRRLMHTAVTPNHLTWVSMLLGLMGAACFTYPAHAMQVLGALFFLSHSILDGCDGELARLKFMESRLGGILDFWSDNIVHIAIFAAMGVSWLSVSPDSLWPWLCAALAVGGTLLSATLVYVHTMRAKKQTGPLYTSVSTADKKSAIVRIADILSRRDFIYLVLLLAILNQTHWFLIMTAIGAPTYALTLIGIMIRE